MDKTNEKESVFEEMTELDTAAEFANDAAFEAAFDELMNRPDTRALQETMERTLYEGTPEDLIQAVNFRSDMMASDPLCILNNNAVVDNFVVNADCGFDEHLKEVRGHDVETMRLRPVDALVSHAADFETLRAAVEHKLPEGSERRMRAMKFLTDRDAAYKQAYRETVDPIPDVVKESGLLNKGIGLAALAAEGAETDTGHEVIAEKYEAAAERVSKIDKEPEVPEGNAFVNNVPIGLVFRAPDGKSYTVMFRDNESANGYAYYDTPTDKAQLNPDEKTATVDLGEKDNFVTYVKKGLDGLWTNVKLTAAALSAKMSVAFEKQREKQVETEEKAGKADTPKEDAVQDHTEREKRTETESEIEDDQNYTLSGRLKAKFDQTQFGHTVNWVSGGIEAVGRGIGLTGKAVVCMAGVGVGIGVGVAKAGVKAGRKVFDAASNALNHYRNHRARQREESLTAYEREMSEASASELREEVNRCVDWGKDNPIRAAKDRKIVRIFSQADPAADTSVFSSPESDALMKNYPIRAAILFDASGQMLNDAAERMYGRGSEKQLQVAEMLRNCAEKFSAAYVDAVGHIPENVRGLGCFSSVVERENQQAVSAVNGRAVETDMGESARKEDDAMYGAKPVPLSVADQNFVEKDAKPDIRRVAHRSPISHFVDANKPEKQDDDFDFAC